MGTEPGEEKCYLFAGDNNAVATAAWQQPLSSIPLSLSATPKDRRRTHCDSAATNTSRLKIHLGAAAKRWTRRKESLSLLSSNHLYYCKSQERSSTSGRSRPNCLRSSPSFSSASSDQIESFVSATSSWADPELGGDGAQLNFSVGFFVDDFLPSSSCARTRWGDG